MIKTVTRMNPTLNGPPHVGHLFMSLVNQHEAHSTDGKFIVRFDDIQRFYVRAMGGIEAVHQCGDQWKSDFEWAGVFADDYQYESDMEPSIRRMIRREFGHELSDHPFTYPLGPNVIGKIESYYPYTPELTMLKVVADCLASVNHLIRGTDLVSEYALYQYFCDLFKIRPPAHTYIPRLSFPTQEISKTESNMRIGEFRQQGWTPDQLRERLAVACLINPNGLWAIDNVKQNPEW
jgi:glutamyl/glutaminyl-tRNA synthetase